MADDERKILKRSIEDHQAAIDKAKKELEALEVTYSIGDRFKDGNENKKMLVVVCGIGSSKKEIRVVDMKTGHTWGFIANNIKKITKYELSGLLGSFTRYWDNRKQERI